ncbi:MAG: AAA family ATPase [Saccharofermentanales bacterium]
MLIRFSVGNFLSFKDVQEFSLLKGKTQTKSDRVYESGKIKLLKFAALFGANASGKSNLVSSIGFAQNTVINGLPAKLGTRAFKLDPDYIKKPSYFEFEILLGGKCYAYGFEAMLDDNSFVSEWLLELNPTGTEKVVFSRDVAGGKFESDLNIKSKELRNKFGVYSDDMKKNHEVLFLTEMNRAKDELYKSKSELTILRDIFKWIHNTLDINYPDEPISGYSYFRDTENKEEICRIIRSLGTGISDFIELKSTLEEVKQHLPKQIIEQLEPDLKKLLNSKKTLKGLQSISIRSTDKYFIISLDESGGVQVTTIAFHHGNDTVFDFSEESDGTRRILDLIEVLISDKDRVYVIDEIDRSLHPQLTFKLVKEFLLLASKRNIQLIITTHESRLLDFGLLRQDEIWMVNKNSEGATDLYSLDEYNVRFDKKVDKAYLEGRYGGVPIFSSIFPVEEKCHEDT